MPEYRKTKTVGVYVRHQARCPAGASHRARCRCKPSYRGRRWDPHGRRMVWSDTFKERAEVLSWLAATLKGQAAVAEADAAGPTFRELADEWLGGVHSGAVARRRGRKGAGYSPTTLEGSERSLRYSLQPEFGARAASEIDEQEWQTWVDRLSRPVALANRQPPGRSSAPSTGGQVVRRGGWSSETRLSGLSSRRATKSPARGSPTPRRLPPSSPPCRPPTRCRTPSRSTPD